MNGNCGELIVSAEELARIQAACQRRATELEVANNAAVARAAATPATISDNLLPSSEKETQRFAPAVPEMPSDVRRFFGPEDPPPPWQWESDEDRLITSRVFLVALCSEVSCVYRSMSESWIARLNGSCRRPTAKH